MRSLGMPCFEHREKITNVLGFDRPNELIDALDASAYGPHVVNVKRLLTGMTRGH